MVVRIELKEVQSVVLGGVDWEEDVQLTPGFLMWDVGRQCCYKLSGHVIFFQHFKGNVCVSAHPSHPAKING